MPQRAGHPSAIARPGRPLTIATAIRSRRAASAFLAPAPRPQPDAPARAGSPVRRSCRRSRGRAGLGCGRRVPRASQPAGGGGGLEAGRNASAAKVPLRAAARSRKRLRTSARGCCDALSACASRAFGMHARSAGLMLERLLSIRAAIASMSYGLTSSACVSSSAAPANSLRMSARRRRPGARRYIPWRPNSYSSRSGVSSATSAAW